MAQKPDNTLRFPTAEAKLFLRARHISDGKAAIVCDRMVVQDFTGNEDDIVIYERDGKRRAGQLRMLMVLGPQKPATSVSTDFNEAVEDLSPEEEKRLLAVYDMFPKRTWPQ
ncbi:MAG: hypothetical protein WA755_05530 [Candidatus Acidiferrales bacterium]